MGTRIRMYAVDMPHLEKLLDQSVGEVLWHYAP